MSALPLRDLIAHARLLEDTLSHEGRAHSAGIIRSLIERVVPLKLVPTRGIPIVAELEPIEPVEIILQHKPGVWCDQCDRLVKQSCASKFCKVST